jgi:hypothetical protein
MSRCDLFNPPSPAGQSWRDRIKVHPAADLFPLTSELDELGANIFSALLCSELHDTFDDLTRILRDERDRITEAIPHHKRSVLARAYLDALGVGLQDLRPLERPTANPLKNHADDAATREIAADIGAAKALAGCA